jgi:acetyl esterase
MISMPEESEDRSAKAARLEPLTQRFVDATLAAGQGSHLTRPPADARRALLALQSGPIGKPGADIEDTVFPVGPTGAVRVRIVRPRQRGESLPVVIYFHGGGWIAGDAETHDRLIHDIAVGADAGLVFVEFDLSPEAAYPIAVEQGYAAMKYVVEHGSRLGLDATRLAVAGDCAGGNLAAVVTLISKERRGPRISLQVLFYPTTSADFATESYRDFADGPWLTRTAMERCWDAYLPKPEERQALRAAPLHASLEQLKGLPEALIIVAENDVLRDEGEAYARRLSDAGVAVTSVRYNGTIHDFVMLNALADAPATRGAIAQASAALRRALQ